MKAAFSHFISFILLTTSLFGLVDCRPKPAGSQQEATPSPNQASPDEAGTISQNNPRHKHHRAKHNRQDSDNTNSQTQPDQRVQPYQQGAIPQKVLDVLQYVRQNNRAMDGYVGGRNFGNFESRLPKTSANGQRIQYQEWDVNPKVRGQNRGAERLITGSDNRAYYTNDHYNSFTEVK